jgi:O-methyltransferase
VNRIVEKLVRRMGYELVPKEREYQQLYKLAYYEKIPYITSAQRDTIDRCLPYTQTRDDSLFCLIRAIEYLVKAEIDGAFVECGVWKGGSVMAMALTLDRLGCVNSDIYLFDTFRGMPPGGPMDVDSYGNNEKWYREERVDHTNGAKGDQWNAVTLPDVQKNIGQINSRQRFHYLEGKVEETIPAQAPDKIAVLRLDTDFYSSTRHELVHLYPRLASGGILIIDDYGHFVGARKAVDEFVDANNIQMFLHRLNYSVLVGVKP